MKRILLTLLIAASLSGAAFAQRMPPGKWWRRPEIIKQLQLTADQQNKLDGVFQQHAMQLIDLKADVDKRSLDLRNEIESDQPRREVVLQRATRVNEARGKLFERELMMLLDMRAVLSSDQWTRMRSAIEERERRGDGEMGGPPPHRRPGGMNPGGPGPTRRRP